MVEVSVIVPMHNAAETLTRTLHSVRNQEEQDWQAVIVDDGSSDASTSVADSFISEDGRFQLLRQDQRGAAAARNAGLAAATGRWVLFLDSDDALHPAHLATLVAAAAAAPDADVLHCGWRRIVGGRAWWTAHPAVELRHPFAEAARYCPFAIHAALTLRQRVVEIGGFDPKLDICEDWDLWQRLARSGAIFRPVANLWADVFVRRNSLSGDTRRHLQAGLSVIRRAHQADPRVPRPLPELAAGLPPAGLPLAIWCHSPWVLGAGIGRGEDVEAMLAQIPVPPPADADAYSFAAIFEDGLVVGALPAGPPWPDLWHRFERQFERLQIWLDAYGPGPRFGTLVILALQNLAANGLSGDPPVTLGRLHLRALDVRAPADDLRLPDVDRLRLVLHAGGSIVGTTDVIVHEGIGGDEVARIVRPFADGATAPPSTGGRHLATLIEAVEAAAARSAAAARAARTPDRTVRTGPATDEQPDYRSVGFWEDLFAAVDPWDYGNAYEAVKYEQTVAILDGRRFDKALELACAEGLFTRRLAAICGRVVATDLAPTAVARAAERLADLSNVELRTLDLLAADYGGPYDLIVCSEVLYYLESREDLVRFAQTIARHLRPGGWFVTAHANLVVDEPDATGFGWPHIAGVAGIVAALAEIPDLALSALAWSPLYRIARFEKVKTGLRLLPERLVLDTARPLPERVAAQVWWRGARTLPPAAQWNDVTVLMYHRIVDDGPPDLDRWRISPAAFARQLAYLRDTARTGLTLAQLREVLQGRHAPPGSVVITFDDGTRDFLEYALPLLHRYGFPATLFVPTDHVGGAAVWDGHHGDPAPLLDWPELRAIAKSDVTIASHAASHRRLRTLTTEELVRDLIGAKAELEARLDGAVDALAYPYGDFDPAIRDVAAACGYRLGFSCVGGPITQAADAMALLRNDVRSGLTLAEFARLLA